MEIAMDHVEFTDALKALGYSRERFAELVDVSSVTTVQNWSIGAVKVPGPIAALVEYLLDRPEARQWFEQRRPQSPDSKPRQVRRKKK
jgi:DNA-binding transcriptional regulator YiaG